MKIKSLISGITKTSNKTKAFLLIMLAIAFPAFSMVGAQNQVLMEGHTEALNITAGQTTYSDSVSAKVDEVVQVQVWQHNREMPDTTFANNNRVKVAVPTAQGKTQVITGTSSADNANTVTDTTTVNLSLDRARIEVVPGSAKFKYNKGAQDGRADCMTGVNFPPQDCFATVAVSETDLTDVDGINLDAVRGGPLKGCNAYHETVTVQVRVKADVVSINKYARHQGQGPNDWKTSITAKPGDSIEYMIRFKNEGNTQLNNVVVADNMPKYIGYVNGTTNLRNGANPNGLAINSDNLTKGGILVGNYLPEAVAYVSFKAKVDPIQAYEKCSDYDTRNVGIVKPQGMNDFYNTAQVIIKVECKEVPPADYTCELLKVEQGQNRTAKFTVNARATGAASIRNYTFTFGDGKSVTTDKNVVEHTYAADGQYGARVTVLVSVNGQTKEVTSDACAAPVNFTGKPPVKTVGTTPTTLPETGAGETILAFIGVATVSGVAYYAVIRRAARV